MGTAFTDKIRNILEFHSGNSWLENGKIIRDLNLNHKEGFFYNDKNGKAKCISRGAILSSLQDAKFWMLIESDADKTRLTDYGRNSKDRGKTNPKKLSSAIADILDEKTRKWTDDASSPTSLDLQQLLNEIRNVPSNTLPTPYQLWSILNQRRPEIFAVKKFTYKRFVQILNLLGKKGTRDLIETQAKIFLFPDDDRLITIRPNPVGE
jgi:hypothetical protein